MQSGHRQRRPRFFGILPAAGQSRRMGTPKLLLPWADGNLLQRVLACWRASQVDRVLIVTRQDDQTLQAIARSSGAVVVTAQRPAQMKHSVQAALRETDRLWQPGPEDAWLLAPADMPRITPALIDRVLGAHDQQHPRIVQPRCQGRGGHPVLFPWSLAREVFDLPEQSGINILLRRHPVCELQTDETGAILDVDTPEDYQRLRPS